MDPLSFVVMGASMAINAAISYAFPSQGPRIKDMKIAASTYGAAIPVVFGTVRTAGNMIWAGEVVEHKQEQSSGKGGSVDSYTYTCSFAFAFGAGPAQSVIRIWADGNLIYDATGLSEITNANDYTFTFYLGTETQMPDPTMEAQLGTGNTPAFRGMVYVVFPNFPLTNFGNRVPQMTAQLCAEANNSAPYTDITYISTDSIFTSWEGPTHGARGVVDYGRGYLYVVGSTGTAAGIRRIRLADGVEDLQIAPTRLVFTGYGNGEIDEFVVAHPSDGTLVVDVGGETYKTMCRVDPISYQIISSWGVVGATSAGSGTSGTAPTMEAIYSLDGTLIAVPEAGRIRLHDGSTLAYQSDMTGGAGTSNGLIGLCPYGTSDVCALVYTSGTGCALITTQSGTVYTDNPSGVTSFSWGVYDQAQAGVIYAYTADGKYWIAKWSADTLQIAWRTNVAGLSTIIGSSRLLNNELSFAISGTAYVIDTVDGTFIDRDADQYVNQQVWEIGFAAYEPNNDGNQGWQIPTNTPTDWQLYDSIRQTLICLSTTNAGVNRYVNAGLGAGTETSLDVIVDYHLRAAGLTTSDYDLSDLEAIPVYGYGYANQTDVKSVLAELRQIYLFDLVESDFIFKARVRGGTVPDADVSGTWLGSSSDEAADFWVETRTQEADLPQKITMSYMDINNDFNTATAAYSRPATPIPVMFSPQQGVLQTNCVMDSTSAALQVRTMMYTQWTERVKHQTRLPWYYINLDPSDLINVQMTDGRTYFERVDSTDLGADLTIITETMNQDGGVYTFQPLNSDAGSATSQTISLAPPVRQFMLNTTLLRDQDDTGGVVSRYYSAAGTDGGLGSSFNGAVLYRSTNDSDFTRVGAEPTGCEWGVVYGTTPAGYAGPYAMDFVTTITIWPAVTGFTLSSCTDDQLYAGANLILVGAEALQFRDATQNANGSWTISNLLRAQRGTEWACNAHGPNEFMIALDTGTINLQTETLDAKGAGRWYKGVGIGQTVASTPTVYLTYMPRDLMPYAPENIRRTFAEDGDCTIAWDRRTRVGGTLEDGTPNVPLNETAESYEVYILDQTFTNDPSVNAAPTGYVRMYSVSSPSVVYTAAEQAADGFVQATSTLYVVVYQISGSVGRGFPGENDIPPWDNDIYIISPTVAGTVPATTPGTSTPPSSPYGGGSGGYGVGVIGCPAPETLILMADGTYKPAGELEAGDKIRTRHETTMEWGTYEISHIERGIDDMVIVDFMDGRMLKATYNHRVHTVALSWVELQNLAYGDTVTGDPDGVVFAVTKAGRGEVMKITVDDAHTYITEDILSHNIKSINVRVF